MQYARENSVWDIFTCLRMALVSIGFGQTCSSSTLPHACASTNSIPSISSEPNVDFPVLVFPAILLRSLQMRRDLPQLFLLVRRKIRFYDSCPASLPFALRCPSQLSYSARTRYHGH
jgi:hypothetical protein